VNVLELVTRSDEITNYNQNKNRCHNIKEYKKYPTDIIKKLKNVHFQVAKVLVKFFNQQIFMELFYQDAHIL